MDGFKEARSLEEVKSVIEQNELVFVFLYGEHCSVCHGVLPQVKPIVEKHKQIKTVQADVEHIPELSGEFTVFTVPVILLFFNGKEVLRMARFIEMEKLSQQLKKITEAV
ncbi:MAG: thioredoxin family protein [Alkalibacterium sp.]|nr:thioredoxin family protein [Alkalibacterium sp.]